MITEKKIKIKNAKKEVDLSNNKLVEFPESVITVQLYSLDLASNQISQLPKSFGSLTSLDHLNLSDNQLRRIPKSIGKLKKLQYLILDCNDLTVIPNSISDLSSLTVLFLKIFSFILFTFIISCSIYFIF